MEPYIKDNILHHTITKGTDFALAFDSPDLDLTQYTTLRADFKSSRALDSPPLISIELGTGISVTPAGLDALGEAVPCSVTMVVPYTKTAKIKFPVLYMDLKGRMVGGSPVLLMTAECDILESTTELLP